MDRQKVAKEAIAHYNKVHANPSSEAKNFYIGGWLDGLEEFASLVKRMREAEEELLGFADLDDEFEIDIRADKVDMLKREVDEYLKKMEE